MLLERKKKCTNLDRLSAFGKRFDGLCASGEATLGEDDYESLKVLMVSSSADNCVCIMDSRCLFQMTPNYLWFQLFTKLEGCSIFLGDNKSYKITEIRTIWFYA